CPAPLPRGPARRGRYIDFPPSPAGLGISRRDEAFSPLTLRARAVRDPLAAGANPPPRGLPAIIDLGLPTDVPGLRIECDHESVGRCEIDHVLVDGDALASRPSSGDPRGVVAAIFPDQVAVGHVDRLNAGAGCVRIN